MGSQTEHAARIALAGTPNCGKTALFNALTGARQRVANYPGVTVEHATGALTTPMGRHVTLLDLPGTYSLRGRSLDEAITRDMILGTLPGQAAPDLLLCVADSTSLRLCLRLALELVSTGRPAVLVLNMADIAARRGIRIDQARLSAALGMPVVDAVAVRRGGTQKLLAAIDHALAVPAAPRPATWQPPDAAALRGLARRADAILRDCVRLPDRPDTTTARLDAVLLHPVWGMAILLAVLFVMFQAVFSWAELPMQALQAGADWAGAALSATLPPGLLAGFLRDGVIGGVGTVVVFLPQILILFLFILLLEDVGYMARAAFLMDKIMGGAGLHGRAFIPLLSSFACAIPGIMATRVIDSRRDRLATILVAPLMTCSARIPVYTLIIANFVPDRAVGPLRLQGMVMFGLYAAGIASALLVSWLLKRVIWRATPPEPFMLALPDYKWPGLRSVALGLYARARAFLVRAGTTIAAMMVVIWVLCTLPPPPPGSMLAPIETSFAARIGQAVQPILAPVGFNWQISVALIPGMAAREVAVASLGTVYAVQAAGDEAVQRQALGQTLAAKWSLATALAFLAWYVFAPQCASTLATIRRETGSWGWAAVSFGYMLGLAYLAAFITYRVAVLAGAG